MPETPTLPPADASSSRSSTVSGRLFGSTIAKQLAAINKEEIRGKSLAEIPRISITHGHRQGSYAKEEWIKPTLKRTSRIGQHGVYLVEMIGDSPGQAYWACTLCDKQRKTVLYVVEGSSSAACNHLRTKHRVFQRDTPSASQPRPRARDEDALSPREQARVTPDENWKYLLYRLYVGGDLPLRALANPRFKSLLAIVNHDQVERLFPRTVTGIWEMLEEQRVLAKQDSDQMEVEDEESSAVRFEAAWYANQEEPVYNSCQCEYCIDVDPTESKGLGVS